MAEWFYTIGGEDVGPMSDAELKRLADQGTISDRSLVRKGKDSPWVSAGQVTGLFSPKPPRLPIAPSATMLRPRLSGKQLFVAAICTTLCVVIALVCFLLLAAARRGVKQPQPQLSAAASESASKYNRPQPAHNDPPRASETKTAATLSETQRKTPGPVADEPQKPLPSKKNWTLPVTDDDVRWATNAALKYKEELDGKSPLKEDTYEEMEIGQLRTFVYRIPVIQIVDDDTFLTTTYIHVDHPTNSRVEVRGVLTQVLSSEKRSFLVTGYATKNLSEDQWIDAPIPTKVVDKTKYTDVMGASRTVFVLQYIDVKKTQPKL